MKKAALLISFLNVFLFAFKEISADEVAMFAGSGDAILVDVRTAPEWAESGVIERSHLITYFDKDFRPLKDEFMRKFSKVTGGDKNKQIVVICRTGQRSKLVAGILDREGYKNVYNYKEGIVGWIGERKPTVKIK